MLFFVIFAASNKNNTAMRKQTKSPVQLREKKLKDGSVSLYLDIYLNGRRTYKFLKMYLSPGTSKTIQAKNKATLLAAQKIAADTLVKMTNDRAGIFTEDRTTTLLEWMWIYHDKRLKSGQSPARAEAIGRVIRIIEQEDYANIRLSDINERTLEKIIATLDNGKRKPNTVRTYYMTIVAALNVAVKERKISRNPNELLDTEIKPKLKKTDREYLTMDELDRFEAVKVNKKGVEVQRAFVFSARYSGLRLSDLRKLKWSDIQDGQIRLNMTKTRMSVAVPLTQAAIDFLGTNDSEYVFPGLQEVARGLTFHYIRRIARLAGIQKEISMHTSRHTFAVALLSAGVDIYTVSKLLGHRTVSVTEIYADIIDSRRNDAMEKLAAYMQKG